MYVGKRLRGMPNDLLLMHIYSVLWFHMLVGSILHFFLQQKKKKENLPGNVLKMQLNSKKIPDLPEAFSCVVVFQ